MKNRWIYYIISFAFLASCTTHQVSIRSALPDRLTKTATAKDCAIVVEPVEDKRVKDVYNADWSMGAGFYVLLSSSQEGPIFSKAETLTNMKGLGKAMQVVLDESGLFSGKGKKYTLQTELMFFYGVSFYYRYAFDLYIVVHNTFRFAPTGYVGMKLTLMDENKNIVSERYVDKSFLLNLQVVSNTNYAQIGYEGGYPEKVIVNEYLMAIPTGQRAGLADIAGYEAYTGVFSNTLDLMPLVCLKQIFEELPYTVAEMIADEDVGAITPLTLESFSVIRMTREYDFVEEVVVDYKTGDVVSAKMIRRTFPVCSKPDEWVVSPVQKGYYLSASEYKEFVGALAKKYNVGFDKNLTAANFYGIKK